MNTPGFDDARYALGIIGDLPVIAWEDRYHGWILPSDATIVVTDQTPPRLPDDATDAAIAHYLDTGGVTLVIGDPFEALDHLPPATWTIELDGPTITVRTPENEVALTAEDHTTEAAVWNAVVRSTRRIGFYTGRDLLDRAGNFNLDGAAQAGTLIAGAANVAVTTSRTGGRRTATDT